MAEENNKTQEQMKIDENAAKKLRAEMAAYDEYLIRGKPEKVEEDEEEFVPTPRQLYNGYSHNGTAFSGYKDNEEISDSRAKFLKNSILKDYLTVTEVANAHAGAVASIMTPEETAQLGEDNVKKLAAKYVEYYNANPEKVTKDELIAVLNSPIGKDVLDPEKGINLTIDRAEDLIASERVDANNIGKNNNQLRAYALDYTISDAHDKISRMRPGKQRTELEQNTVNTSYKYAANSEIMMNMNKSSLMGRYALDKVFDGHLDNLQGAYPIDEDVIKNVMADAARKQESETAVSNYNRTSMEYGRLAQNLDRNGKPANPMNINSPLKNMLAQEIIKTNNQIQPGTKLDTFGHELEQNMTFDKSEKMNALQEYIDFSEAYRARGLVDYYDNPCSDEIKNLRYYNDKGNSLEGYVLSEKQAEYAMYICCRKKEENKKKLTDAEQQRMSEIERKYGRDHLGRMYDITSEAHSRHFEIVKKKRDEIYKKEGVYIDLQGSRISPIIFENAIQTKIDNNLAIPVKEWNNVIRKSPTAMNTAGLGIDEFRSAFGLSMVRDGLAAARTPAQTQTTPPEQSARGRQSTINVQDIILRRARENQC